MNIKNEIIEFINFVTVKNTVGLGEKLRKFAIVFDDFERCGIEKKQLLGAINEYSENRATLLLVLLLVRIRVMDLLHKV